MSDEVEATDPVDPEQVAKTPEEPGLLDKAKEALGLGGDTPAADPDATPGIDDLEEAAEEEATEADDNGNRRERIRRNMGLNLGNKEARKRGEVAEFDEEIVEEEATE